MNKRIIFLSVACLIIAVGFVGNFYFKNLRGASTAFKHSSVDIVDILTSNRINSVGGSTKNQMDAPPENFYDSKPLDKPIDNGPLILPPGFKISIFAKDLIKPRVMAFDPHGKMLVSIPAEGKVVILLDEDSDGTSEKTIDLITNLNKPHGLAFKCNLADSGCKLYVAQTNQVTSYTYDQKKLIAKDPIKLVDLPTDGYNQHHSRTILFSKKTPNELLISVGSSCNVCNEKDERRAKILTVDVVNSPTEYKIFASGLRNAVFMAHHPVTEELWVTEMGRDLLGDDTPPDEINVIERGQNYGWPICYGKNIWDTEFDKNTYARAPCTEPFERPSTIDLQAHSAPLGLAFVPTGGNWPAAMENDLLVAYHGSWNRTVPTGYKLTLHKFDNFGKYIGVADFITGWLRADGTSLGRPADVLVTNEEIFISDDKAGVIYRVVYEHK